MLDAIMLKAYKAYLDFQLRLMEIENSDEEEGDVLQTIIVIAVAVIIAGFIVNALTGKDGKPGLIEQIFTMITEKLQKMFDASD